MRTRRRPPLAWLALLILAVFCAGTSAQAIPGETLDALASLEREARADPEPQRIEALLEAAMAWAESAEAGPGERAQGWYWAGQAHELAGRGGAALGCYEQSTLLAPGGPRARHAHQRIRVLRALPEADRELPEAARRFLAIQQSFHLRTPQEAMDEVAGLLEGELPTALRVDMLLWLGSQAQFTLVDLRQSWTWYEIASRQPVLSAMRANAAFGGMAAVSDGAGRIRATSRALEAWIVEHPGGIGPFELSVIREELWDQTGNQAARRASWCLLPLLPLFFLLRRGWRAWAPSQWPLWRPLRAALLLGWVFGLTAWIGETWAHGNGLPLALLAPAVFLVHAMTRGIALGGPPLPRSARIGLAALSAAWTWLAMWCVLWMFDKTLFLGI